MKSFILIMFYLSFNSMVYASLKSNLVSDLKDWQVNTKAKLERQVKLHSDLFNRSELSQLKKEVDKMANKMISLAVSLSEEEIKSMEVYGKQKAQFKKNKMDKKMSTAIIKGGLLFTDKEVKRALEYDRKTLQSRATVYHSFLNLKKALESTGKKVDLNQLTNQTLAYAFTNLSGSEKRLDQKFFKNKKLAAYLRESMSLGFKFNVLITRAMERKMIDSQ